MVAGVVGDGWQQVLLVMDGSTWVFFAGLIGIRWFTAAVVAGACAGVVEGISGGAIGVT